MSHSCAAAVSPELATGIVACVTIVRAAPDVGSVTLSVNMPTAATSPVVVCANLRMENVPVICDGVPSTGNGRRASFRNLPIPRMTKTFFAPGEATADELIGGVEKGLYAVSFGGGQVEPATGDFVFGVSEGYLIEGGRVTAPVRGATLIGNGIQALAAVDGIAGDLAIATGYCGKEGQSVPAGVGQPHVRIRELTVGGTA